MKYNLTRISPCVLWLGMVVTLWAFASGTGVYAASPATNATVTPATNVVTKPAATPPSPITVISDDDDKDKGHSFKFDIKTDDKPHDGPSSPWEDIASDLIPLAGIVFTFGTPIAIVFFVAYFKYRRRQESMALAREYLNKGLPVPAELLDPSQGGGYSRSGDRDGCSDLRRGFKLAFIGLGVTLALYIDSPHSTQWGWGLIPLVMGIGYLISGWVDGRRAPPPPPGSFNPPPAAPGTRP